MSILYIVATPIGNLEDITKRALRVLSGVDLILCEDTRKTRILLDRFQVKTLTLSYHQHSKIEKINYIADLLRQHKAVLALRKFLIMLHSPQDVRQRNSFDLCW